ncbi:MULTISPECIES: cytochrome-c peroxidase [Acetobacter]|uniref:Putative cytochrome c peroxidase n=1 Tax=Acetobacter pomorum DM001 TaxID=945681 RepID=F1YT62_9PROT|nr:MULTISPECIES: cytochrome-c peroxidase [Acetobacter]ATI11607.1 cytochrome-c peroxidase [Acetobacter pomorum]AXC26061.1 cytochrome-c peroxidase [Acetobacter sp. JWB]EGE48086.1 Putative cytochrome c peroxidase [Acetobacter pomorum DM001]KAA8384121.1 c-type cytochrome [Acetobacter sp. DmW_136]KAA8427397.1 c-type cytochrome [Acetobacter pomorum]
MKRLVVSAVGVALLAYGGTVAYLQHFDHITAPELPASSPTLKDPVALAAFNALREARCDYCHAEQRDLPFYFRVPVAKTLMEKDRANGLRHFRVEPVLDAFEQGTVPTEEQLSRIEEVITQNRMPPNLYLMMHWHAHLSNAEREAVLKWVQDTRRKNYNNTGAAEQFAAEPIRPVPESVEANPAKWTLGRKLFFDKSLSGDNTLNCASCHGLDTGGVDNLVTATGIGGQKGPINTPTVYDAYFKMAQFWNARATTLADQAAGPVMNPVEMGSHNWEEVANKLNANPEYAPLFKEAFGPDAKVDEKTITTAIGEFEKTLVTPNGAFDEYLKGKPDAISEQAKRGYERFKAIGCSGCHTGIGAGGRGMEIMGLEGDYFKDRGGKLTDADEGRYAVTHEAGDMNRFVVPNLRNVELTGPYFHDGSVKTLDEAVRKMARYQTPDQNISDQDVADIVAFLKTLTGRYDGKLLTNSNPAAKQ